MTWTRTKKSIVWGSVVLLLAAVGLTVYLERQNITDYMVVAKAKRAVAKHIIMPVDMTGQYVQQASSLEGSSSYWGEVPWEFQVFHNVPLNIDGIVYLWGAGNAKAGAVFPKQVLGIPVNEKFDTLYVYHCTFYNSPKGTPVYDLVFRYENGDSATNTVKYGIDTMDFNTNPGGKAIKDIKGPTGHDTKIGWIGSSFSADGKHPLLFSLTAMKNPQPAQKITSIDLFSSKNQSAGVILAMTGGPAGLMQ